MLFRLICILFMALFLLALSSTAINNANMDTLQVEINTASPGSFIIDCDSSSCSVGALVLAKASFLCYALDEFASDPSLPDRSSFDLFQNEVS